MFYALVNDVRELPGLSLGGPPRGSATVTSDTVSGGSSSNLHRITRAAIPAAGTLEEKWGFRAVTEVWSTPAVHRS